MRHGRGINPLSVYRDKLYDSRYFWLHLARVELKNKFRRSKLGILWTFVSPLCLTLIMSVVFATVFKVDIATYAPYILSGILFWDIMSSSFVAGSYSIVGNDSYIRQFNHPVTIYTLKSALVYMVNFSISMIALILWLLFVNPAGIIIGIISFPLTLFIYFCLSWATTTISAFMGTKYRDFPQMVPLILQFLWYISPVFFQESMFKTNDALYLWFNINPITHLISLVRSPFVYGTFPSILNYLVSLGFAAVFVILAVYINKRNSKNIIFYI